MEIADKIKSSVTMQDIFSRYGFQQNRGGFIPCPFHSEKTASLSPYANGTRWKCFGCGESGSVIDFVMMYFNLDFWEAVRKINADFGLGLVSSPPSTHKQESIYLKKKRRTEAFRAWEENAFYMLVFYKKKLLFYAEAYRPHDPEKPLSPLFVEYLHNIDRVDYLAGVLATGTDQEKISLFMGCRNEVRKYCEKI